MNDLLHTELFGLLAKNSKEVTNDEMENAYVSFVEKVKHINQSEDEYLVTIRVLNFTRIEFVAQESLYLYDQGGKRAKILYKESNIVHRI